MKCHSRILAAFVLALILILHSGPNLAQAARFVFSKQQSSSETLPSSTSQTLKVHEHGSEKQPPLKKVKSSFRRIPRSRSNPTQNK
ncbi:hypothetical protein RND71_026740 [Anisodus tanguticus]|uniref:Uncharacterized protein n=1 Tax=Anisodus tanguticus TaxID=243964 RepID=A0AAE1RP76_9SOLA|nr:hypothetical protein RND71_026740 [Anisodus tanguticus]